MDRVFIEGKVADLGLYVADPSIDHVFIEVIEGRVAELVDSIHLFIEGRGADLKVEYASD